MSRSQDELIQKKLEQISAFIAELHAWTARPFAEFAANTTLVRASERNFQLMVELASDINAKILIVKTKKVPDTYRDSFMKLVPLGIISDDLAGRLVQSVAVRNVLVHDYDFEEDYAMFFRAIQDMLPWYEEYVKRIAAVGSIGVEKDI